MDDLSEKLFELIGRPFDLHPLEALLAAGADPNGSSVREGWTPLFAAIQDGGDLNVLRLLLEFGANPAAEGDFSVLLATCMGLTGAVRLLAHGANPDLKDDEGPRL